MRSKSTVLALILSLLIVSLAFGGDKYQVDVAHSSVGFSVRHLMISNVKGQFKEFSGTIILDEEDITQSSVGVTIKTASIATGQERRDNHLKSAEFFDVEKYPELTFKSKSIEKADDGYRLVGDLTIKDVTKEVSFPFNLVGPINSPFGDVRIGAEATLTINRQDFGVSWNKALEGGGLVVGNEVKITLEVEAVKSTEGTN